MTIASELFATLYTDVDSTASLLAHACKGVAMYLIFHGTVAEGLNRPFQQVNRAREQLRERLRFEALLTELSTELAEQASVADIRAVLRSALLRLVEFTNTDRGVLLETSGPDVRILESVRLDRPSEPIRYPDIPGFTWLAARLRRGTPFIQTGLPDSFPAEAVAEKRYCIAEGIRACAYVPCSTTDSDIVAIGLCRHQDNTVWNEETGPRLRLAGEMFANALRRGRSYDEAFRLRSELNHVTRVSTMGQLTAALAHEIKQPLTAILSNAQVGLKYLRQEPLDRDELEAILSDIAADDRRATDVIGRIRGLVKKDGQHRKPARLSTLADELLSMLGHALAGQRVEVVRDFAARERRPAVDPTQIQQVMLNLIMNAAEAMNECPPEERTVLLSCKPAPNGNQAVRFSVTDQGEGIPENRRAAIFDPFVTSKKGGMGMGLAISRGIVEDHGGRIWVESSGKRGTTITFELPISSP
jgi:signal transduction histidine kinase